MILLEIRKWALGIGYNTTGAGNLRFCDLLARVKDVINIEKTSYDTGNARFNCFLIFRSLPIPRPKMVPVGYSK